MFEGSMIAEVGSGQREFEPDPVPAVCSVREHLIMQRNHKMRQDVVLGVNSLIYT
jgi:hypothetical protein